MKRLGTVTEACDQLGLPDVAATWDMVASGQLIARRGENPDNPDQWTVYLPDEEDS